MEQNQLLEDIEQKSSKGVKWVGITEIFIRVLQFCTTIVLARLLMPEDFGIINVALIFTQLVYVLFDFGFSAALIQRKELTEKHYSTTFFFYLTLAIFFSLIVFTASPFAARYFQQDELQGILRTLTLLFFVYAITAVPHVILMKEMRFKELSLAQLSSIVVYGTVTIMLAWNGAGVWSFVYGSLSEQMILAIILVYRTRWRPRPVFEWNVVKELAGFGKNVFGTHVSGYINTNAPNFIIGRILGSAQLGFYSIAYQFIDFPVQRISKNILKVMFPAFSKIQDQPQDFKILYKQTFYYLALILFPVFAGMAVIAPQFVTIFYGQKWMAAILPLQILTIVGLVKSLWLMASVVFLSRGKPQIDFYLNLVYAAILIPVIILAVEKGIEFVAVTIAAVSFFFLIIAYLRAAKIVDIKLTEIIRILLLPVLATSAFLIVDFALWYFFLKGSPMLTKMLIYITVSVIMYSVAIRLFDKTIMKKLVNFLFS